MKRTRQFSKKEQEQQDEFFKNRLNFLRQERCIQNDMEKTLKEAEKALKETQASLRKAVLATLPDSM